MHSARTVALRRLSGLAPITALLLATPSAPAQDAAPPAAAGKSTTQDTPAPAASAVAARIDAFLDELEKAGTTIESISGAIALEKYDALVEETERRYGRLVLDRKDGRRRFTIRFDQFVDGSGRSDDAVDHWIYADGWLVEQDHRNRSFTKRQIVPPGESFDPLALGEGPIPIPVGQKKAEVRARFEVAECEIPQDIPMLGSMQNVAGLRLVPKAGTAMAKETEAVLLFYDRTSLAPTGVVVREKSGNRTVARISSPVVNGAVKDEDRALLEIPNPDAREWTIDIRPWKKAE
jgi:hypothetical protein